MRRSLREQSSRARDELEILRQTEGELRAGKNRLDDILARLAKEQVTFLAGTQCFMIGVSFIVASHLNFIIFLI